MGGQVLVGSGGGFTTSSSSGTGGGNIGCSGDLHSVIDGQGNVLQMCSPDQGCANAMCVPACDAAGQSKGTLGCDFYVAEPSSNGNGMGVGYIGACYAVFIANGWGQPAKITVSRDGQTLDVSQFGRIPTGIAPNLTFTAIPSTGLPAGQVAVLFLSHDPTYALTPNHTPLLCPVTPAFVNDVSVQNSGIGSAFHVTTDAPVNAYDIMPYGGATTFYPGATLFYPTTAWGTNYYAVATRDNTFHNGKFWLMAIGSKDGTNLQLAPPITLPGGGALAAANQGQTNQFTINAGQVLQWEGADPSGAVLQSDQPVAVFAGHTQLLVVSMTSPGGGGTDSAHQQLPPIPALGSEYVGPSIATRLASMKPESVPYRLLGVVDGTTLTWDPQLPGAPTSLNAGQIVEFETTQLFTVSSQDGKHPFTITEYMPGAPNQCLPGCGNDSFFAGQPCGLGDEDWVVLLPPKQFLHKYVFFTDPTYATTQLVFTRQKGPSGFSDVNLACLGGPVTGWQPVGTGGMYEVAYVNLVFGGAAVANCATSQHQATSDGNFGVIVWGTDWYASYAYAAGGNAANLNTVVVPPVAK
jgi:hypothetical protein